MGAIVNGIVLHGPTRPFGGTFLIFSDYMRPSVRLAALDEHPVDLRVDARLGRASARTARPTSRSSSSPTLRAIPNVDGGAPRRRERDRPAAWLDDPRAASGGRAGIALTRQNIPVFERGQRRPTATLASTDGVAQGAYILAEAPGGTPDVILIGDRLRGAARRLRAREHAAGRGRATPASCRRRPLGVVRRAGRRVPRVGAARGRHGARVGRGRARRSPGAASSATPAARVSIDHFGASADYKTLFQKFGITAEARRRRPPARLARPAASVSTEEKASHEHPHDRRKLGPPTA